MPAPYCDIDTDVKPWLGIDNATHDSTLTIMRDSVERAIENYVEVAFELTPLVGEILDSNGSDMIITRNFPISSVQQILTAVETDGSGGDVMDTDRYQVLPHGIVLRAMINMRGRSLIRVDYTHGFDGIPPDIKEAILLSIEAKFRRKGKKTLGTGGRSKKDESESGGGSAAWDAETGLPTEVLGMLKSYRSFEFPTQSMATRNP